MLRISGGRSRNEVFRVFCSLVGVDLVGLDLVDLACDDWGVLNLDFLEGGFSAWGSFA